MAQDNPQCEERALIWSPLPELCFEKDFSTKSASTSKYVLTQTQLVNWPDFEATVRATTRAYLGSQTPIQIISTQTEEELVCVGNEYRLMGRFGQHVAHVMTKVNNMCSVPIRYGDYQVGKTIEKEHEDAVGIPDLVLVDDEHGIRGVCEDKTFWTRVLSSSERVMRALWLGQLARYMDDHYLVFGCFTTYRASVFLRRVSTTTFRESPVILSTTASTETGGEGGVSLRECFLYFAIMSSRNSYRYPERLGLSLTNESLVPRERRSSRLGKGEAKDEAKDLAKDLKEMKIEE